MRPSGARWAVPNDADGVVTLVERLQPLHPTLMVLEATSGLERGAPAVLATVGRPGGIVNPRQARAFARATGQLAKTDALEARALAHVADVLRPTPRSLSATVGLCGAGAPFGTGARFCAPCCIWARAWRHVLIRRSKPLINGYSLRDKSKKSL